MCALSVTPRVPPHTWASWKGTARLLVGTGSGGTISLGGPLGTVPSPRAWPLWESREWQPPTPTAVAHSLVSPHQ